MMAELLPKLNSLLSVGSILPHINASLNLAATILLLVGLVLIKFRREGLHKLAMISCFLVSVAFLGCYLAYHAQQLTVPFPKERYPSAAMVYYVILATHIPLAALVPVLALVTIILGYLDRRTAHRRWAKWTWPIWLYTAVTGVLIYLMLYVWFPSD